MKKTLPKYYRSKKPTPLTDKQKIELLNTKVISEQKRAKTAEDSLESFKSGKDFIHFTKEKIEHLETYNKVLQNRCEKEYCRGFADGQKSWKFWKKK